MFLNYYMALILTLLAQSSKVIERLLSYLAFSLIFSFRSVYCAFLEKFVLCSALMDYDTPAFHDCNVVCTFPTISAWSISKKSNIKVHSLQNSGTIQIFLSLFSFFRCQKGSCSYCYHYCFIFHWPIRFIFSQISRNWQHDKYSWYSLWLILISLYFWFKNICSTLLLACLLIKWNRI